MSDDAATVLQQLTLAYGPRFSRQFGAAEPTEVQAAWRKQLAGLTPRAIEWGLHHLPEKPPNAVEFHALCTTPPPRPVQAPKPAGEPTVAPPHAVALADALGGRAPRGPRQWAIDLQAREASGERLTRFQRRCWREALGQPWEDCA